MRGFGGRRGDGGGAHAGLIGEDAAGDAVLNGHNESRTHEAAAGGRAGEGIAENHGKGGGELCGMGENHVQPAKNINDDH